MGRVHPWIELGRVGLGHNLRIFLWDGLDPNVKIQFPFHKMSVKRSDKYIAISSSKRIKFTH